jgi:hypothetical protein
MSNIKEIIRTSGDVRRILAQTMIDVKDGSLEVSRGLAVASLAKELNNNLQVEVNIAKVRVSVAASGKNMGEVTEMGRLVIEDAGSVPTLRG